MYIYMYIVNKYAVICVMNCDVLFASKQQSSEEKQKKKTTKEEEQRYIVQFTRG